jgi:hypothetical protein
MPRGRKGQREAPRLAYTLPDLSVKFVPINGFSWEARMTEMTRRQYFLRGSMDEEEAERHDCAIGFRLVREVG